MRLHSLLALIGFVFLLLSSECGAKILVLALAIYFQPVFFAISSATIIPELFSIGIPFPLFLGSEAGIEIYTSETPGSISALARDGVRP